MIAEQIPLVLQQARNLKRWCTPFTSSASLAVNEQGPSIGAYGSFNPYPDLKKMRWEHFFSRHDLFVFTAETLKNLLKDANLQSLSMITDLDYFIIDEVHHTTKNHPFNILMDTSILKMMKGENGSIDSQAKQPRILAVTATCGGKMDVNQSTAHLQTLCENVDCKLFSQVKTPPLPCASAYSFPLPPQRRVQLLLVHH